VAAFAERQIFVDVSNAPEMLRNEQLSVYC
jgi:hypothetical protein